MSKLLTRTQHEMGTPPIPVLSLHPVALSAPERSQDLTLRVSAPVTGRNLPVILFAHGFGSSAHGYAPLVNFWAAHGFVVIQPTFLDSRSLSLDPKASHREAVKAYLDDPRKKAMWRYRVDDMKQILNQLNLIEATFPGLQGRLDLNCIAAVGHSFGAQTVGMLLGARIIEADGHLGEDLSDARIKAGVLLSAGGRGGPKFLWSRALSTSGSELCVLNYAHPSGGGRPGLLSIDPTRPRLVYGCVSLEPWSKWAG